MRLVLRRKIAPPPIAMPREVTLRSLRFDTEFWLRSDPMVRYRYVDGTTHNSRRVGDGARTYFPPLEAVQVSPETFKKQFGGTQVSPGQTGKGNTPK